MASMKFKNNQVPGIIDEAIVNGNTFENETFNPTLINYFYGKNGTGKSTISGFLKNSIASCRTSIPQEQFELLVYNNEFITEEIQSYGNIPGLFTITQANAKINAEIKTLEVEKRGLESEVKEQKTKIELFERNINSCEKDLLDYAWDIQKKYNVLFSDAIPLTNSKKKFLDRIRNTKASYHDEDTVSTLYHRSFSSKESLHSYYRKAPAGIDVPEVLISTPIVSSGSTPFAEFVKELKSADWVKRGHDTFQHASGGKCPYCQQLLPEDFEEKIASCFDQSYQRQIEELQRCANTYRQTSVALVSMLRENTLLEYNGDKKADYEGLLAAVVTQINTANDTWQRKISEPASSFELPDISGALHAINICIDRINKEIKEYNDVIENRISSQKKCIDMIWEQMAFECTEASVACEARKSAIRATMLDLEKELADNAKQIDFITGRISDIAKDTINTTAAKDNINQLIRDAGFQGFEIREKNNAQYVYELVRKDGSVVKNLSEGERNFVGFLYFYNIVMNSRSDDGVQRDKVVVIDDPVSSMDSSALFSVASLVRNLEEICYNNYSMESSEDDPKFIKQFFCLTHNPFFFKEISYNHIPDYECANFYELSKDADNHSHIRLCHKEEERKYVNLSPIKNNYEALWAEYRTTTDSVILMNVIRRILEYYFVQIGGFKENDLRKNLLDKNRSSFPSKQEYDAAAAMIAYLNTGIAGFDDGLYFDANAVSVNQMRSVFKNIFYVLNQGQHYEYMMG